MSLPDSNRRVALAPEEEFLWRCASKRGQPLGLDPLPVLDWERLVALADHNRVQPLLHEALTAAGLWSAVPKTAQEKAEAGLAILSERASVFCDLLQGYLSRAAEAGIDTVVLKGVWVSQYLYGRVDFRPGVDVDILVRWERVEDALGILESLGLSRCWRGLMHDRFYARHHLHQVRCRMDVRLWVEIHWALDHPYSLLTMDLDAFMDRTVAGSFLGALLRVPRAEDALLALAVHLVKHAIYLPSVLELPELLRLILADGMLLYCLDVAELIKGHAQDLDWDALIQTARLWGADSDLGAVCRVCQELLEAPIPREVLEALTVQPGSPVKRWAMERVAAHELATYQGATSNRMWDFLLGVQGSLILRPIRVLDTFAFLFPNRGYLTRRYGSAALGTALAHLARAAAAYTRLAADTVFYSLERLRYVPPDEAGA